MSELNPQPIDQRVFDLYDDYCHGRIDRREFFRRAGMLGAGALAMANGFIPQYANAQTIGPADPRIKGTRVTYPSPGGNSGQMGGYLVQPASHPAGKGPFPAVLVVHENRGLNPYVEDVARRVAIEGFLALAPDGLYPDGGYPGNDDDGRDLQASLMPDRLRKDFLNSARWLKAHALSTGKLGVVGFCWGGGTTNYLAVELGPELAAAAPYYGPAPATSEVRRIKSPLVLHFAEHDQYVNSLWPDYEKALKAAGVKYEAFVYPGTQHGFHNNTTPRYNEAAAKLSWERTMAHFRKNLS